MDNNVRDKAYQFVKDFENANYEKGESQTFWDHFFDIFGISVRHKNIMFEHRVGSGYIDAFWPGMILVEQKSEGLSLDGAYKQAWRYLEKLPTKDHPKMIVVSDFKVFRLYSMDTTDEPVEFPVSELPYNLDQFTFLTDGSEVNIVHEQDPVSIKAAQLMAKLHENLAPQYEQDQHSLKVLLVRIMFLFFADDTEIIRGNAFLNRYFSKYTRKDGGGVGSELTTIFKLANTSEESRPQHIREHPEYSHIPYINGKLFTETIQEPFFDENARDIFLQCADYNWRDVSPAIFGSMFQAVMSSDVQRALGAHYTAEYNILKVLKPLFVDKYWENFRNSFNSPQNLGKLLKRIKNTGVFDPACGCGNFLVVAYRELRELELATWKRLRELQGAKDKALDIDMAFDGINVDNMYGIEIEDFPAQIAQAALWLEDHLMNIRLSNTFGEYYARIPLKTSPNIIRENALKINWEELAPREKITYIASNPPFIGSKYQTKEQRAEVAQIFEEGKVGTLDYVTAWYRKAAEYINNTSIEVGYVSTNSITQGEQVGVLWNKLKKYNLSINFAHRTFRWTSDIKGAAAVFVVIIGFSLQERKNKYLSLYPNVKENPETIEVKNINPYLVDAPTILLVNRSKPLSNVPELGIGNKPIDGGYYLFTYEEKEKFIEQEPRAEKYFRPWIGSREFFNGVNRYCLWLGEASPSEIRTIPKIHERVENVRKYRQGIIPAKGKPMTAKNTKRNIQTKKLADIPTRFHVENLPDSEFLIVPEVSSEKRDYIPLGYLTPPTIVSNLVKILPDANLYIFGVLSSRIHMDWIRQVCGRLKGDYRYSIKLVYNNFPWPNNNSYAIHKKVEICAQTVLNTRKPYLDQGATFADLYDPVSMPSDLLNAHHALDKAVDKCYRDKSFESERDRLKLLFKMYEELTK